jgi:hypothetical protein
MLIKKNNHYRQSLMNGHKTTTIFKYKIVILFNLNFDLNINKKPF